MLAISVLYDFTGDPPENLLSLLGFWAPDCDRLWEAPGMMAVNVDDDDYLNRISALGGTAILSLATLCDFWLPVSVAWLEIAEALIPLMLMCVEGDIWA